MGDELPHNGLCSILVISHHLANQANRETDMHKTTEQAEEASIHITIIMKTTLTSYHRSSRVCLTILNLTTQTNVKTATLEVVDIGNNHSQEINSTHKKTIIKFIENPIRLYQRDVQIPSN